MEEKQKTVSPADELRKKLASFPRHGIFSAFVPTPENVHFETQEEEEKPLLLLRRHVITNTPWILISFALILVPFFYHLFPFLGFLPKNYLPIIFIGWYLLTSTYIFENFLLWFYNIYIVTDERIIDVDFYNILYKEIADARIDKIQDVSYDQNGFVEAIFNYGDILIQTAAEQNEFVFEKVPAPEKVVEVINLLIDEEKQEEERGIVT